MSIPRRLIQIWGSPAPGGNHPELPLLARAAVKNLKLLHPDWDYVFFDDQAMTRFVASEFPQYRDVFDGFRYSIQRFDFFRYLAVFRLGGFYFDLDVLLAEPIDALTAHNCVFPFEELSSNRFLRKNYGMDWELGNYAFGAASGDQFLGALIQNCARAQRDPEWVTPIMDGTQRMFRSESYVLYTTGPGAVSRTYAESPDLATGVEVLFPDDVRDPATWHRFGSFGVHLMNAAWRPQGGRFLRRIAQRWEVISGAPLRSESQRLGPTRAVGHRAEVSSLRVRTCAPE